jgi:hypothetical protein
MIGKEVCDGEVLATARAEKTALHVFSALRFLRWLFCDTGL